MNVEELRLKLPPLPKAIMQSGIDITDLAFTVWGLKGTDEIKAIAFLRDRNGDLTVWTPGFLTHWVWRGPLHISQANAELLATWLNKGYAVSDVETVRRLDENVEVKSDTIWLWDVDPSRELGLGVLKIGDGAFELSLMMAGLRRGGANMGSEDGRSLEQWLMQTNN